MQKHEDKNQLSRIDSVAVSQFVNRGMAMLSGAGQSIK